MQTATDQPAAGIFPSRTTTRISDLFASAIEHIKIAENAPQVCPLCFGTGLYDPDKRGMRPCECRREKLRARAIARIPERNRRGGIPILADMKAVVPLEHKNQTEEVRRKISDWQSKILRHVRAHPFASINLCGKNKIGKSQIAYALYLNAFEHHRIVRCFKMAELLADYARAAAQSFQNQPVEYCDTPFAPRLTVDELGSASHYTIVIDEFHNVIPSFTEAQMRTTFEVLDAIKAGGHQLILLSNFPFDWLREAMAARKTKLGESAVYVADSILSRISEDAVTEELFF